MRSQKRMQAIILEANNVGLQHLYKMQCNLVMVRAHEDDWQDREFQYRETEYQLQELKLIKAYALVAGFDLKRVYNDPT